MYICDKWYVLYVLVDCRRAWMEWYWLCRVDQYLNFNHNINSSIPTMSADSQLRPTTRTNCHIYTLLPPDDGQLASLKHVEV
jgi:hypothetical protein